MKTRVTTITNLVLSLTLCMGLQSCNKDEFYAKEFLNNPFQDSETTGTVDAGAQGGVDSGVDGTTQGGVTGSSTTGDTNGGVDGSTTGGSTTGSTVGGTDGTATTGGTAGGATGGVDGSTTSGQTTGSTTGGVDGSTSSGSTTGSTVGGVDGSTTSGSTNGSATGGTTGSTTGTSTGGYGDCNQGSSNDPKCNMEKFKQASSQTKKLDIMWIIDNSGSMADEQTALGTNFSAFIDEFISKDVDFKMAITTTDTSSSDRKGRMVTGSDTKLTSTKAMADENQFKADFRSLVRVGTNGSGYEKGLEASEGFMQKYSSSFIRPDAYLAVVVLSDEEDQSAKAVSVYTDYLKTFKAEAGLVKVYTIADVNRTNSGSGITVGADRYIEASNQTAGVVANIRDDFHQSLTAMGDSIINLLDSFALAHDPVLGSLKIYVNGVLSSDYTFDAASRSIKFDAAHLPPVGADVTVYYIKQ
jgi:hypothetical protein